MNFIRISLVIVCLFYFVSCQNGVDKKYETEPQKKINPSTEFQKKENSIPEMDVPKPVEKPLDKEVKKKKLKAIDTLKPVVTIP